jgi:hypothetical protein
LFEERRLKKGKFEEQIVQPYIPNKIVPPEFVRDVIEEANADFPTLNFDYELPHKWRADEYQEKYEELERQMIEVIAWKARWFGQKTNK